MTGPVSLRRVIEEMDVLAHEYSAYLNRKTGEMVSLPDDVLSAAEEVEDDALLEHSEWQAEMIEKAREVVESEDWLKLPDRFEIHEYRIMEDFCRSVEDPLLSAELLQAIRGKGAFRRFKDAIDSTGMVEDWERFRDKALEMISIDWLEEHQISYTRDT